MSNINIDDRTYAAFTNHLLTTDYAAFDALYGPWNNWEEMYMVIREKTESTSEKVENFKNSISVGVTVGIIEDGTVVEYWKPVDGQGFVKKECNIKVPTKLSDLENDVNYVKLEDIHIPTNVGDFNNDAGYITSADVSDFITKNTADGYYQPKGNYATKEWVDEKKYLTEHQSLDGYVTKDNMNEILKDYLTGSEGIDVDELAEALNGYLTGSDIEDFVTTKGLEDALKEYLTSSDAADLVNKDFLNDILQDYLTSSEYEFIHHYDGIVVDQEYIDKNGVNAFGIKNTKYLVIEPIVLNATRTVVAEGCTIEFFKGASMDNNNYGDIYLTNTEIKASSDKIFEDGLSIRGLFRNAEILPEWFGAKGDGVTDDGDAFNRALKFCGHTPLVGHAEKYFTTKTITVDEQTRSKLGYTEDYGYVNNTYDSKCTIIFEHDLIGGPNMISPVLCVSMGYATVKVLGAIVVMSNNSNAIGFANTSTGNHKVNAENIGQNIYINIIVHGKDSYTYAQNGDDDITLGTGCGAVISGQRIVAKINDIYGFESGVALFCQNSRIEIGGVSCKYGVTNNSMYMNGCHYILPVTRNKVYVGDAQALKLYATKLNSNYYKWIYDNSNNPDNDSALFRFKNTWNVLGISSSKIIHEVALNEFYYANNNNGQHPNRYTIFNESTNDAGFSGNIYRLSNTQYHQRTTEGNTRYSRKLVVFKDTATGYYRINGEVVEHLVGSYLHDNFVDGNSTNVVFKNIHLCSVDTERGSLRWRSGANDMGILFDTVTYCNPSTPDTTFSSNNCIRILKPSVFELDRIRIVNETPTSGDPNILYISTVNTINQGTVKYPVYAVQCGVFELIGYYIDEYGLIAKQEINDRINNSKKYESQVSDSAVTRQVGSIPEGLTKNDLNVYTVDQILDMILFTDDFQIER